eukprot:17063-Heterococcus_DN1.PRE.1
MWAQCKYDHTHSLVSHLDAITALECLSVTTTSCHCLCYSGVLASTHKVVACTALQSLSKLHDALAATQSARYKPDLCCTAILGECY